MPSPSYKPVKVKCTFGSKRQSLNVAQQVSFKGIYQRVANFSLLSRGVKSNLESEKISHKGSEGCERKFTSLLACSFLPSSGLLKGDLFTPAALQKHATLPVCNIPRTLLSQRKEKPT